MTTAIEVHECMLGPFARKHDAKTVGLALIEKGWPIIYADEQDDRLPKMTFDTLADYRRFMLDWEATVDALSAPGPFTVSWACECDEDGCEPCPHGDDPVKAGAQFAQVTERPLNELWGCALREAIEHRYPGLRAWIRRNVDGLYGALAFGLMYEEATGEPSAAGLWLRRHLSFRKDKPLRTYDRHLDDFAGFLNVARDDAWLSEVMARAGLDVDDLQRCPACDDFVGLFCECGGEAA